jgi:small subunit ribosomal protein S2
LRIPVIAIVDTNCDPDPIDWIVPGNDDAIRAVKLISHKMSEACIEGQMALAQAGIAAEGGEGEEMEPKYEDVEAKYGEYRTEKERAEEQVEYVTRTDAETLTTAPAEGGETAAESSEAAKPEEAEAKAAPSGEPAGAAEERAAEPEAESSAPKTS